jgi:hypothetical protein
MSGAMCSLHSQVLEPLEHLFGILIRPFTRNCAFHNGEAIFQKVVPEVTERLLLFCAAKEELASDLVGSIGDGLCCARHVVGVIVVVSVLTVADLVPVSEKACVE